jgi:antitoxin ParD1/3/4
LTYNTDMNVSLTPELEGFVAEKVSSGQYSTASEVVREALRELQLRDQIRQQKLEALKREIQIGLESSTVSWEDAMKSLKEKYDL